MQGDHDYPGQSTVFRTHILKGESVLNAFSYVYE